MFNRFKARVLTAVSGPELPALPATTIRPYGSSNTHLIHMGSYIGSNSMVLRDKFAYGRPPFLQLMTSDELRASADHNVRPIIVPRDVTVMPWCTGYAECVNSGKSQFNEDQATFHRQTLSHPNNKQYPDLPYIYFGMFDGHAGYGAALAAANQFHHILHEKLVDIIDLIMPQIPTATTPISLDNIPNPVQFYRTVSKDELIIGALESAFLEMDTLLAEDRNKYRNAGGCTAIVTLFIFGKMFVANAGDSRAVLCQRMSNDVLKSHSNVISNRIMANGNTNEDTDKEEEKQMHIFPIPFSHDHTPDTERSRIMSTANLNPALMGGQYVAMEYAKRPMIRDLGTRILYRQGNMKGWAYKTLTEDDLKRPIVTGEGKRSRLLGTIGVTRGFGDHNLRALGSGLPVKPFLSSHPDVNYRDLTKVISIPSENNEDGDYGILIMATDGLWDVADTESVSRTVFQTLKKFPNEKHRYTMIAQELVARSRGRINDAGHWRLIDSNTAATVDDISVLVIPVYQYYKEYNLWERACYESQEKSNEWAREMINEKLQTIEKRMQEDILNKNTSKADATTTLEHAKEAADCDNKDEDGNSQPDNTVTK